jgi:hypothetical protein
MSVFQNALTLAPSFYSSFFPPDVGQTQFQPNSAYNQFLGDAGSNGFLLPNRFIAIFENPWLDEKFQFSKRNINTRLSLRCFTVHVPQRYFSTHDRDIAGPKRKIPYNTDYDELSMQFYCGPDLMEVNLFQDWMDGILNPVTRHASFYDDYAKNSKITLLFVHNSLKTIDGIMYAYRAGNLSGIRFLEVYPRVISINGGPLEWASKSTPLFITVTFGSREFVNIKTYDAEMEKQLKRLQQSDLTNSLDDMIEQTEAQNMAFGGSVVQTELLKPNGDLVTSSSVLGKNGIIGNIDNSGLNVASGGRLISTTQTNAGGTFIA